MLQHVQNFYNKRKKLIANLENQLKLIEEKERKLQHSKEKLLTQISEAKVELNLSEEEVNRKIIEASISNNKKNTPETPDSEKQEEE